jgi:alpha-NAC-related protein
MFPSMDPQKMQKMLKKLGMKMDNIPANQVIIKTDSGNITIDKPQVIKTAMKGQVVFQISGDIKQKTFTDEDVKLVMGQTGVDNQERIKELLQQNNGDVAKTIMQLKE